ncbi:inositol monophosphatase family protein [Kiloniella sp. b19]|uniref:inositol monophosphatase family protein n=1 Tax=Kiloniella sp. GXU_MW_B19 TaxID=3141326 RepID=UPI0031D86D6D
MLNFTSPSDQQAFNKAVDQAIRTAAAQEIMPRFQKLGDQDINSKAHGETVTIADIETEKALSGTLTALLSGSRILGEECYAENPDVMQLMEQKGATWVIDPIDGTNNYASGKPVFRCMVALVLDGKTTAGWIYNPVEHTMLSGWDGLGAFINGKKQSLPANPEKQIGTLHSQSRARAELKTALEKGRKKVETVKSLRCAGAEYDRLVRGELAFSCFSRLMPWDHLAGALIHREAGGYNACLEKQPYTTSSHHKSEGLMMAPDRERWEELHTILFNGIAF